jgi:hypothetical protein
VVASRECDELVAVVGSSELLGSSNLGVTVILSGLEWIWGDNVV